MARSKYTYEQLKKIALSDPEVKAEYDKLEPEFALLRARLEAGKTQEEVAQLMHTTKSAISWLENGAGKRKHAPSIETLRRYAEAIGYALVPHKEAY